MRNVCRKPTKNRILPVRRSNAQFFWESSIGFRKSNSYIGKWGKENLVGVLCLGSPTVFFTNGSSPTRILIKLRWITNRDDVLLIVTNLPWYVVRRRCENSRKSSMPAAVGNTQEFHLSVSDSSHQGWWVHSILDRLHWRCRSRLTPSWCSTLGRQSTSRAWLRHVPCASWRFATIGTLSLESLETYGSPIPIKESHTMWPTPCSWHFELKICKPFTPLLRNVPNFTQYLTQYTYRVGQKNCAKFFLQ